MDGIPNDDDAELLRAMKCFRNFVGEQFDKLGESVHHLETRITAVEARLVGLEAGVDRCRTEFAALRSDLVAVQKRR